LKSFEPLLDMDVRQHVPTVLLTLGDPNGLGPELTCRILSSSQDMSVRLVLIGPEQALMHQAQALGLRFFWRSLTDLQRLPDAPPGIFHWASPQLSALALNPGKATIQGGLAAGLSLEAACDLLAKGAAQALVTCPLNKAMFQQAGFPFPGHTEFLATRAGMHAQDVCMHFWGPRIRVSLVTTHPALRQVPDLITQDVILRKLELTLALLRCMGDNRPVAVCGLNPHAGEEGHLGDEEGRIIAPAVAAARSRGRNVVGPLAADTAFRRALLGEFSAILAMYHDQGLGPFKLLHFHTGIQITLGLPYVRTSPDHGTGYELVGTGQASTRSLKTALDMAVRLANWGVRS
jgi:4-hydroxythreonine-4-phosphate dehydrogenase